MDQEVLAEIKAFEACGETGNPRYMELLNEHHYVHHVLRMPVEDWPEPVQRGFAHINPAIYVTMQGPSELGISPGAKLAHWERTDDLASIEVPTLVIGARYDTMDPAHMEMMAGRLPNVAATCIARRAVTLPCTTTRSRTSPDWSSSCTTSQATAPSNPGGRSATPCLPHPAIGALQLTDGGEDAHSCRIARVADAHTHAVVRMFTPYLGSTGGHACRAARHSHSLVGRA